MATYAVGDIQGCFQTFQKLLQQIRFDPTQDRLWCAGDLVNRGPFSLEVLRFARSLRDRFFSVLGNHDLHLLKLAAGVGLPRKRDTLQTVLQSADLPEIVDWLRQCPLIYREGNRVLVHAGIHPNWRLEEAEYFARKIEEGLQSKHWRNFLSELFPPDSTSPYSPLRQPMQVLTRIRMCQPDGSPEYDYTGPPGGAPAGLKPWFSFQERKNEDVTFLVGHWAALGLKIEPGIVALDTGCVWGKKLTAYRLEDGTIFQEPTVDPISF
jgi:bis(5'-nucleosyl)-tetraphosphatase (symmetrical)